MNEVAMEIIKQIGDELQKTREELQAARELLDETTEKKDFWWGEWCKLSNQLEAARAKIAEVEDGKSV